jgi:hypothetical protein
MFLGLVAAIFNVVRLSKDVQRRIDKQDQTRAGKGPG